MRWWVDFTATGVPPVPLWELDQRDADEVRFLLANVELPEPANNDRDEA